jgi:hypothetical protein
MNLRLRRTAIGVTLFAATATLLAAAVSSLFRAAPPPPAQGGGAPDQELSPAPNAEAAEPPPVFRDWLALGSGCHARSGDAGDVTMERFTLVSGSSVVHRARFHLEQYRLQTADRAAGEPLDFARECAVRVQLGPPAGKRIARVAARMAVVSSKSEGVKLTVLEELHLGVAILGRSMIVHESGSAHEDRRDDFDFVSGARPGEVLPPLGCSEGKLVGFDSTWIAERKAPSDQVTVRLEGDQVVDIDVELSDC